MILDLLYPRKRLAMALSLALLCLIVPSAQAKDNWTSVHSKNFTLVGNAGEKDIRQVANRLEQFRTVFALLFPSAKLASPVPTTVIVFKSEGAYKPFKINPNVAGYFQPGDDVNYITLTSDIAASDHPFQTIFHEYVHLLVENSMGSSVPVWFNEGLAEYYSTFDITDENRKVLLGDLIANHVLYLRESKFLPLRTLLAVDHHSPYYNERNKMNIFYAESWMLMHYLLQGEGQKRRPQLGRFIEFLGAGATIEDGFQKAFQVPIEDLEKGFKSYIQGAKYMATGVKFEKSLDFDSEMQSAPITEAEAEGYLGDLLVHTRRYNDAEAHLQKALALTPGLPMAEAALGMLRVRQNKIEEARQYLEKAVQANSQNYLTHFYYAYALSGLSFDEYRAITNYPADVAQTMRAELKKSIALKPDYAESYALLGFVNVVRNEELDETIALLKRSLELSRANQRTVFMLAQLYMRKENFAEARLLLEPISRTSPDPELRQRAGSLLEAVNRTEDQIKRYRELDRGSESGRQDRPPRLTRTEGVPVGDLGPAQPDLNVLLSQALRKPEAGETRAQAVLTAIECNAKGIVFVFRAGERLLKLHTDNFERVVITAFTNEVKGEITCGPRKPENAVVVTYAAAKGDSKADGEISSLEFVPANFVLKQ